MSDHMGEASKTLEFRRGVLEALDEELARDERVIFFGEDVAEPGGVFAVTGGLHAKYGEDRVFDTPISELAIAGAAFGSAVTGLRPVVEIMFGDFLLLAMDSLVNQSAKYWYLSNEQASVPLVVRSAVGGGSSFRRHPFAGSDLVVPGSAGPQIVAPSGANDAKRLLKAAIRDDNPVLFLEHKNLYSTREPRQEAGEEVAQLAQARVVRAGRDITLVSCMNGVNECRAAAEILAASGIEAEVLDLRTLRPIDREAILDSLSRTHRLVAVEEGPLTGGWAGEVLSIAAEEGLDQIDVIWRLATPDRPIPFSPGLEDDFFPSAASIAESVRKRLE